MPYIRIRMKKSSFANSVDLERFLQMRGEKLEKAGREYKLIYYDGSGKHDSITISGSAWFDHKNQVGGGAIKFMRHFTVWISNGNERITWKKRFKHMPSPPKAEVKEEKPKEFKLT